VCCWRGVVTMAGRRWRALVLVVAAGCEGLVLPTGSSVRPLLRRRGPSPVAARREEEASSSGSEMMNMVPAAEPKKRLAWWGSKGASPVSFAWFIFPSKITEPADLLPYLGVAYLIYWRGKKWYNNFKERADDIVELYVGELEKVLNSDEAVKLAEFRKVWRTYRRRTLFQKTREMVEPSLLMIVKEVTTLANFRLFKLVLERSGLKRYDRTIEKMAPQLKELSDKNRLLYYARRLGLKTPKLEKFLLKQYRAQDRLEASQNAYAQIAYSNTLRRRDPIELDLELAEELGLDEATAQTVVDELLNPTQPDPQLELKASKKEIDPKENLMDISDIEFETEKEKAEWLKKLKEALKADANENPTLAAKYRDVVKAVESIDAKQAFKSRLAADDKGKMLTVECGSCGYTMFIAKDRQFKFFGPSFTCPNCGAPRSRFTVTEVDDEEPADSADLSPFPFK